MALGQVSYLISNNLDNYPVVFQRQVGGNRSVESLEELNRIPMGILIDPEQDVKFSLGQLWYVIELDSFYKLISINNDIPTWEEYNIKSNNGSIIWGEGENFKNSQSK